MDPVEARDLFPLTRHYVYMNHAGVAPLSERSRAAIEAVTLALSEGPMPDAWRERPLALKESLGTLLGARAEDIAFVRSTAHGIGMLAQGLDWKPGDNVVGAQGEYPANVYPWMQLEARGVEYRQARCEGGRVTPERVLELVDGRTRVVALSHVEFWNGFRVDIETIGAECRRRGVIFAVDAIQSLGALRVDLGSLPVDFVSAGSYKWLMGIHGIGICWSRPELADRLVPVLVGPKSMRELQFFKYELDYAPGALRFEEAAHSQVDIAAFQAAVDLFLEIGPEVVEQRVLALSDRLARGLDEIGYEVVEPWPRQREESSGIVSFRKPGATAQEVMRDLNASRVVARIHSDFVRLAPHFYNTEEEVDRVLEVLSPERVQP